LGRYLVDIECENEWNKAKRHLPHGETVLKVEFAVKRAVCFEPVESADADGRK
jgi:hypothetical protein